MKTFDINRLFGNNTNSTSKTKKRRNGRVCRIEELESREMLSVSLGEFAAIRSQYADLNLSTNMADYNVIEITAKELSVKSLQTALDTAAKTTQDDLIVLRTDSNNKTLTLDGNPITIEINSTRFGAVAIVTLANSNAPLVVDTLALSRAFRINSGNVSMGGMQIVGQTWAWDQGSAYDGLISVRGQSTLNTSKVWTTANAQPIPTMPEGADPNAFLNSGIAAPAPSQSGVWDAGESMTVGAPPFGADSNQTSTYMIGTVSLTIIIVQSTAAGADQWTPIQINNVMSQMRSGADWWEMMFDLHNPGSVARLTYILDYKDAETPLKTESDPGRDFNVEGDFLGNWTREASIALGYGPDVHPGMRAYSNDQRDAYETDWAYICYVVHNVHGNATSGEGRYGWAFVGGPFTVLSYDNVGWGWENLGMVLCHETGHIFNAADEYGDSDYNSIMGYLGIQNVFARTLDKGTTPNPDHDGGAIMAVMVDVYYHRPETQPWGTLHQIGWRDSNGSGILDILDTPLTLEGPTGIYDSVAGTFNFYAASSVTVLINENPHWGDWGITINTVDAVQYKVDDGEWITLDTRYGGTTNVYVDEVIEFDAISLGRHIIYLRTYCVRTGVSSEEASYSFDVTTTIGLPAPKNLICTNKGSRTVALAWEPVASAGGYEVQYRRVGTTGWIMTNITITGATAFVSGLDELTEYEFQVRAVDKSDRSKWSASLFLTTSKYVEPPVMPGGFRCTATTASAATFQWDAQYDVTGYLLQYRVQGTVAWTTWTPSPSAKSQAAAVTGLSAGTSYEFRLTALNAGGSEYSTIFVATKGGIVSTQVAPENFVSTAQTMNSVTLSWTAQSNITGYTLLYKSATATSWSTWTPAPGVAASSVTVTGLIANTEYEFQLTVTSVRGSATSATHITTKMPGIATQGTTAGAPVKPSKVKAVSKEATISTVTLTWAGNSQNAEYVVKCLTTGVTLDPSQIEYRYTGDNISGVVISGLQAGKKHKFSVVAVNDGQESKVVTVSAKTKKYAAVKGIKSTANLNSVMLTWKASTMKETDGYVVDVYDAKGKTRIESEFVNVSYNGASATITGLDEKVKYTFVIRAEASELGVFSAAAKKKVTTAKDVALSKAMVLDKTDTTVALSWLGLPVDDAVSYIVSWKDQGQEQSVTLSASDTNITIDKLRSSTTYRFTVQAVAESSDILAKSLVSKVTVKTLKLA